jgi:hypothetical protein
MQFVECQLAIDALCGGFAEWNNIRWGLIESMANDLDLMLDTCKHPSARAELRPPGVEAQAPHYSLRKRIASAAER